MIEVKITDVIKSEDLPREVYIIEGSHDLNDGDDEYIKFKQRKKEDIEIGLDFIDHCDSKGYDGRIEGNEIYNLLTSFIEDAPTTRFDKLKLIGICTGSGNIKNAADRLHDSLMGTYYRVDDFSGWLPLTIDKITYYNKEGAPYKAEVRYV